MWPAFCILLVQCIIICSQYHVTNAAPLSGHNIIHARPNEYLYVVSIVRVNRDNSFLLMKICIGTLISRRNVLTAAHCLEGEELSQTEVIAGSVDFRQGTRYSLLWWIMYTWWCLQTNRRIEFDLNDIAVLRLLETVPNNIVPAPLSSLPNHQYYGLRGTIASWTAQTMSHVPTILELANVTIISIDQCNDMCRSYLKDKTIHTRYLCTCADPFVLLDCGDSGGPLLFDGVLIAINNGFCPPSNLYPQEERVNIHFGIDYYREFIISAMSMK